MTKIRTNVDYLDYVDYYVEFSGKAQHTETKEKSKDEPKGKSKDKKRDFTEQRRLKRGE